jgi:hypothetical protein
MVRKVLKYGAVHLGLDKRIKNENKNINNGNRLI